MTDNLHFIQIQILKKLIFHLELSYSELRPDDSIENNKLNFHLNALKDMELIQKTDSLYSLTNKGKEYAGRIDTEALLVKKQSKISAWICPVRNISGENEYLIYTRLKTPFYGCQGFMSGKVDYGETYVDAAKRELFEETGLSGEIQIVGAIHYLVYAKGSNELLEDKLMFMCRADSVSGELTPTYEGKYEWVKESDLKSYVTNHFESWEAFEFQLGLIKNKSGLFFFKEEVHLSEKF